MFDEAEKAECHQSTNDYGEFLTQLDQNFFEARELDCLDPILKHINCVSRAIRSAVHGHDQATGEINAVGLALSGLGIALYYSGVCLLEALTAVQMNDGVGTDGQEAKFDLTLLESILIRPDLIVTCIEQVVLTNPAEVFICQNCDGLVCCQAERAAAGLLADWAIGVKVVTGIYEARRADVRLTFLAVN